jgi:hypothetical protein
LKRIDNKVIDFLKAVNRPFRRFESRFEVGTGQNGAKAFSGKQVLPVAKPLSALTRSLAEKLVQRCH